MGHAVVATLAGLSACAGRQSTLQPAGQEAAELATLFWGMTIGATVIWLVVMALALYAAGGPREADAARVGNRLIIGGGVVLPVLVLGGLLGVGLPAIPRLLRDAPEGTLTVHVTGHQYWWRVRYQRDGGAVELANEIRLPVGRAARFILDSPDVIHSFWIPSLAGKMDMIPGRITRLVMTPTATGSYRGACAEFCGASHALMAFEVEVMEPDAFAAWLEREAGSAVEPAGAEARRGRDVFLASGCGACHAVRGTSARGVVGPDLTHVGSRRSIGAGTVAPAQVRDWLERTDALKPDVHMPAFGMLPAAELDALAVYLQGLE